MEHSKAAAALFSATQQRVLGLLFADPDRSFHANEVIRRTGAGSGAAQRELARLIEGGLVTATRVGNQVHYRADPTSSIFRELLAIVAKTLVPETPAAPVPLGVRALERRDRGETEAAADWAVWDRPRR